MSTENIIKIKTESFEFSVPDSPGTTIHYEIYRNIVPETTLCIHGNLASNRWWYPLIAERQNNKFLGTNDLILAEFRGCGKSSPPKNEAEVNMKTFAKDFIQLIDFLKLKKINLIGHSTGGNIAAIMLSQRPDLFNKGVLLDPVGPRGVTFDDRMIETFERMKHDTKLVSFVMGQTIYKNNKNSDYFKQMIVADAFSSVKTVGHLILKAFHQFNIEAEVKKIAASTLVIHGEFDKVLAIEESEYMAKLIPRGQFMKVANQGHCLNIENPELFNQILNQFLYP